MNRLRTILDGGTPAVAVSFHNSGDVEGGVLADQAAAAGVDIVELRIDHFPDKSPQAVLDYVSLFQKLPTIATIRSREEGGDWSGSEQTRLDLFRAVIPDVDGVDVELSAREIAGAVVDTAKSAHKVTVVSYHNFDETPASETLEQVLDEALALGADYVKISAMAKSPADVQRLAEFLLTHRSHPLIVIAMGAAGTLSRIFFPALGSRMTFSFIGKTVAPGQMDFAETFHMLRKFYPAFNNKKIADLEIFEDA